MLGFDHLRGVLSDHLVATIVGAIIALMWRLLIRRYSRKLTEAVTGFDLAEPPVAIVGAPLRAQPGSSQLTEQPDALPLFGYGPLVSYAMLAARLARVHATRAVALPEIVVSSQYEHLPENLKRDRDLLLLGYPAGNEATHILEPLMKLPIAFASGGRRAIVSLDTGEVLAEASYSHTSVEGPKAVRDCGLLARVRHPLNAEKAILYLAGCETFGVKIAADSVKPEVIPDIFAFGRIAAMTWRHRWLPKIGITRVETTEFVALFSANVQYLSTGTPTLIRAWIRSPSEGAVWRQTYPTVKEA